MNHHPRNTGGAVVRLIAATLVCAVVAQEPALAGTLSFRTVALTGEPAPGTPDGVVFSSFTTPLNHWIMRPVIDDEERVAFIALLAGDGVELTNQSGIWSEGSGALELVVRTGMQAPGTPAGVVFSGVPSDYLPFPPSFAAGQAAFNGTLTGVGIDSTNNEGVWAQSPGGLGLVAREGDPLFDAAAGIFIGSVFLGGINNSGHVMLSVDLVGAGVTSGNDEAVCSNRSGALELIVREGDPAPGTEPGVIIGTGGIGAAYVFPVVRSNDLSQFAVQANLQGAGVHEFNDEALFLEQDGQLQLFLREGDAAPGAGPGVTFGGNSVSLSLNNVSLNNFGHVAFSCRLGGSVPTTTAMYSDHSGVLAPVVIPGDPAPGTDFDFTLFGPPALNDLDQIAFTAATPDNDNDPFIPPLFGIFHGGPGALAPLILPGDPVLQGTTELEFIGTSGLVGFNDAGDVAFNGSVEEAGTPKSALMLSPAGGQPMVVVATGDAFDVAGDGSDVREILRIVAGGLSETGAVAFRLDFTDGSSGHFAASLTATADLNGDQVVDAADLAELLGAWGPNAGHPADLDGDAQVDAADLALLLGNWGAV